MEPERLGHRQGFGPPDRTAHDGRRLAASPFLSMLSGAAPGLAPDKLWHRAGGGVAPWIKHGPGVEQL